jgi:Na+/proline symporter
MDIGYLEFITLAVYMVGLFSLGIIFSRMNRNVDDYIKGGSKATWWMVGASNTIAIVSAFTFTGASGMAYRVGPAALITYLANMAGFLVAALFLARWLRQTRAYTEWDIVRNRFGAQAEQCGVYISVLVAPFTSAVQLWALSVFVSSAFGVNMILVIIVCGVTVTFYSATGGRWAVLATDFVQNLLIFGITILVAVLSIIHIGGVGELFSYFSDPRFATDFQWFKEPGYDEDNQFTLFWCVMIFTMTFWYQIGFICAPRYLAAKTGKEAQNAAWFAFVLSTIGAAVWLIPPVVARFMYEGEVDALAFGDRGEGSYVFMAVKLLPRGLIGIFIAAMFAATMSSMDTGLNSVSGVIVRNIIPPMRRRFGLAEMTPKGGLRTIRAVSVCLGVIITVTTILFSVNPDLKLFQAYFVLGSLVGIPLGFPMVIGIWVKKLSGWAWFALVGVTAIPAIYTVVDNHFFGGSWTYFERVGLMFVVGIPATLVCRVLYEKTTRDAFKRQIDSFFQQMHTPVDYAKEIGAAQDYSQLILIGNVVIIVGVASLLLLLVPNELWMRVSILAFGLSFVFVGVLMRWGAAKEKKREAKILLSETQEEDC